MDDEGIRWTIEKCRPNVNLMNFYNISWKSRNNHFNRHTDIKPKGMYCQCVLNIQWQEDNPFICLVHFILPKVLRLQ